MSYRQHKLATDEVYYQREGEVMRANLQCWKVEQLIIKASVLFANRVKDKECMYTRECFQEFLKALADSIATSDQDTAFLLPAVQQIKERVFGY